MLHHAAAELSPCSLRHKLKNREETQPAADDALPTQILLLPVQDAKHFPPPAALQALDYKCSSGREVSMVAAHGSRCNLLRFLASMDFQLKKSIILYRKYFGKASILCNF